MTLAEKFKAAGEQGYKNAGQRGFLTAAFFAGASLYALGVPTAITVGVFAAPTIYAGLGACLKTIGSGLERLQPKIK